MKEMTSAIIVRKEQDLKELKRQPRELMMLEALIRIEAESYVGPIHKIDPRTIKPVVSKVFGLYLQLGGISRAMLTDAALEAIKICGDEPNYIEEFSSHETDIKSVSEIIDEIIEDLKEKAGLNLSYEDFEAELLFEVRKRLPEEFKINVTEIAQPNDCVITHNMCIHKDCVGPAIPLDKRYEEVMAQIRSKSTVIEHMANEIAETALYAIANIPDTVKAMTEETSRMEWDSIKDKLSFRVLEVKRNKKYLADKVYKDLGCGLAAVPEILYLSEDGVGCASLPIGAVKEMNMSGEEVIEQAMKNMPKISHVTLSNLESKIVGASGNILEGTEEPGSGLLVLSTQEECHGASALFIDGMKDKIHEIIGDYYIIPSSIDEILVTSCNGINFENIQNTVLAANQNYVAPQNILSDEVYFYDGETMMICA